MEIWVRINQVLQICLPLPTSAHLTQPLRARWHIRCCLSSNIPSIFIATKFILFLWTSYQNLCAGSESWKTWQKKKCSMCVLLGQELVVCCMFLFLRRKLGNTFMYAIVFQSLNFRCASKSRVNSGNSKNLSWLRCWTAAENQIQWCHNVTKIVRKQKKHTVHIPTIC